MDQVNVKLNLDQVKRSNERNSQFQKQQSLSQRKTVRFSTGSEITTPILKSSQQPSEIDDDNQLINFLKRVDNDKSSKNMVSPGEKTSSSTARHSRVSSMQEGMDPLTELIRRPSTVFKFGEQQALKKQISQAALDNFKRQKLRQLNREDQIYDPKDEQDKYIEERELVKNLDNFDHKIAPNALNLFAQSLSMKLKNSTIKQNKQSISKQLQQQNVKQARIKDDLGQNQELNKKSIKDMAQANVNLVNLQLIMQDPMKFDSDYEKREIEKSLKISKNSKPVQNQNEILKYASVDNNCDLFSEEAKKSLTKFKIYRPKDSIQEKSPDLLREVKTTSKIASETEFDCQTLRDMPHNLHDNEVLATQMDLYLTINFTENLEKARIRRKQERMMEEETLKMTKVKGFQETINTSNINERMKMETELLNEYKRLRQKLQEQRQARAKFSAFNTQIYNQLQQLRTINKEEDEQIKKIQQSSRQQLEMKMRKSDKATMIRDLMRFGTEKDHIQKLREERLNKENSVNKLREINTERIYYVEQEMEIINTQMKFIKNVQKEHYLKLLKDGKDTRGKGLIWIVECLKDLDIIILKEMMPSFIDESSKEFIMTLAMRDYQLGKLRLELTKSRLILRQLVTPIRLTTLSQQVSRHNSAIRNKRERKSSPSKEEDLNFDQAFNEFNQTNILEKSSLMFTEQGFKPIRNSSVFHHIISIKNDTIRDLKQNRESSKNPYFHSEKNVNQIIAQNMYMPVDLNTLSYREQNNLAHEIQVNNLFHKRNQSQSDQKRNMSARTKNNEIEEMNRRIEQLEELIKEKEDEILEIKKNEIRRLVKDYMNPNSQLRKLEIDYKQFFLCLYGDTYWEMEFFKQVKVAENIKKPK
ncbi:UNKNOWN [Stylonychia lemnae]|uniref:Uncharacterized protein n=1 Tax=Stylonychia lemnae TaxID=5949 RepID=A0A078B811_STYLE|nr:UNKNOWN [Stylonychia lemnae]|eukprot:CDW89407.1 UNKNOWN [Stylonychia lemnae]